MLILDRKVNESVELFYRDTGEQLALVTLTHIAPDKVKVSLGFEASKDIGIKRSELKGYTKTKNGG